jgi:hypothetical protein
VPAAGEPREWPGAWDDKIAGKAMTQGLVACDVHALQMANEFMVDAWVSTRRDGDGMGILEWRKRRSARRMAPLFS